MEINKTLKDEIWDYCRVNNISNIDEFTLKLIKQGFTIEKFGATPAPKEKIVEKVVEKIVEKVVEVPIEKIVEKEVYISSDSPKKELEECFARLNNERNEFMTKIEIFKKQLVDLETESNNLKRLLEEEKNKNKKDIYGENN